MKPNEQVLIRVPGLLKYCHFVSDACELLVRSKINFYSEEYFTCFIQDLRIVMYELFSNAVNHSKSETVAVQLEVDDEFLSITVQTTNLGFGIKRISAQELNPAPDTIVFPPYPGELHHQDIMVYSDFEYDVFCKVVEPNRVQLYHRKNIIRQGNVFELPEHYGLNLITRLTHECSYFRDSSGIDNFVVKKRIK